MATPAPALDRFHPPPTNPADRDEWIRNYLPTVRAIASEISNHLPTHVTVDDLAQQGALGLLAAMDAYESDRGVPFHLYAKHRIRGQIFDHLREIDFVGRTTRANHKALDRAVHGLTQSLGREPEEHELAESIGLSVEKLRAKERRLYQFGLYRHAEWVDQETAQARSGDEDPELCSLRSDAKDLLGDAVARLPPRYQRVVRLYHVEGWTMQRIGDELGVNESRVSQIHKVAMRLLRQRLEAEGVTTMSDVLAA